MLIPQLTSQYNLISHIGTSTFFCLATVRAFAKSPSITFEPKAQVPLKLDRRYCECRVFCYVCRVSLRYTDWGRSKRSGRGIAPTLQEAISSPLAIILLFLCPLYLNWGKPEDSNLTCAVYVC